MTGALGCVGTWAVRTLAAEGTPVVAFDLGENRPRLELVTSPDELGTTRNGSDGTRTRDFGRREGGLPSAFEGVPVDRVGG